jgi:hypothetical protein
MSMRTLLDALSRRAEKLHQHVDYSVLTFIVHFPLDALDNIRYYHPAVVPS